MRHLLPILLLAGCCPIPWRVNTLVRPTLQIAVRSSNVGISEARVVVARYEYYPHFRSDTERKFDYTTDELGRLTVEEEREKETVYPLMMHGIGGYNFHVCAQAPGYQTQIVRWAEPLPEEESDASDYQIAFALEPGESLPCETNLGDGRILEPGPITVKKPVAK